MRGPRSIAIEDHVGSSKGSRDRTLMPTTALDGRRQFDRSYEEIVAALPSLSTHVYWVGN